MFNFFKRVLAKSKINSQPTGSLSADAGLNDSEISESIVTNPSQLVAASALDTGKRRENNEDALLSITSTLAVDSENLVFGLYAVADGMGGHKSGELASEGALRAFGDYVIKKLYLPQFSPKAKAASDSFENIMEAAINEAHKEVKRAAPGGGCTLTGALIIGDQLIIAHLGDSRAYILQKDKEINSLTRDHSLVQLLEEQGQITHAEATIHPQKSILYRALGQGELAEPEVFSQNFPPEGYLLLCTDGLWGVITESEIQKIVNSTQNLHLASHKLVEAANAAGGPDNIAALLVRMAQ